MKFKEFNLPTSYVSNFDLAVYDLREKVAEFCKTVHVVSITDGPYIAYAGEYGERNCLGGYVVWYEELE